MLSGSEEDSVRSPNDSMDTEMGRSGNCLSGSENDSIPEDHFEEDQENIINIDDD